MAPPKIRPTLTEINPNLPTGPAASPPPNPAVAPVPARTGADYAAGLRGMTKSSGGVSVARGLHAARDPEVTIAGVTDRVSGHLGRTLDEMGNPVALHDLEGLLQHHTGPAIG